MGIRALHTAVLALIAVALLGSHLAAYPRPALVNPSWQIDIVHRQPRTIGVADLQGVTRWYWYLPYKVVNNSGVEQLFVPEATVATDQGDIILTDKNVPPRVFTAVMRHLGNQLLESPIAVSGKLLIGEDRARESVLIWPVFENDVDRMTIFFAGLAGESQSIIHPATGATVSLRKTLMISYATPGTAEPHQRQPIKLLGKPAWVMR